MVYPQAREKGLEFAEKMIGFSKHTTFLGDSLRLNQILLNLTSNAIKFITPPRRKDQSALGEGTTFTVELPFAQSNVDLQPLQEAGMEGLSVLVADDEQDICEHTVLLLERMKIRAEWVLSGARAVERAVWARENGRGFDVCFIDWRMPEMDGCEAAKLIRACGRADARRIPIIATTANAFAEDVATVIAAGMVAHIGKPLDMKQLCSILLRLCGKTG